MSVHVSGNRGPYSVRGRRGPGCAQGGPTAGYGTNFQIGSGEEYCAGTGTAVPTRNDATTFLVKEDTGATCVVAADVCGSTTTTTSSTTSTTAPASCANGMVDGDETDVDCGGSCADCADGAACLVAADCAGGICGGTGVCGAATWDPTWSLPGVTYSNGNRSISGNSAGTKNVRTTFGRSSGKWYWEISATSGVGSSNQGGLGIAEAAMPNSVAYIGAAPSGPSFGYGTTATYFVNWAGVVPQGSPPLGSGVQAGNVYMFALDADLGRLWIGMNGVWFNSGDPSSGTNAAATGLSGTVYAGVTF